MARVGPQRHRKKKKNEIINECDSGVARYRHVDCK